MFARIKERHDALRCTTCYIFTKDIKKYIDIKKILRWMILKMEFLKIYYKS